MRARDLQRFRPGVEAVEGRCLAAATAIAGLAGHGSVHVAGLSGQTHAAPIVTHGGRVVEFGGPSGGSKGGLPANYHDWGVVTIWNTTPNRLTFSVSATTYQNGQFFNFTLRPGQCQSYYATFTSAGVAPQFRVILNLSNPTSTILLPQANVVYQSARWYPWQGTEGWPYAIVSNPTGLSVAPI